MRPYDSCYITRYIRLIITLHKCTVSYFRTFFDDIVVDVYKVISAKKLATLVLTSHVVLAGFGAIQNSKIIAQMNITPPHPQHSHEENLPHLSGLPGTADRATRLGEVPHLSCESSQEKKRDCMERLVTPPRWGTSPTWGPPPPCEQALRIANMRKSKNDPFPTKLVKDFKRLLPPISFVS